MKKLFVFCLALVMVLSMSITAFAAGGFVSSPSGNKAPELISSENESEDCEAELEITPYSERSDLSEEEREAIEEAYEIISNTEDLTELNDKLKEIAKDLGIDGSNLAVSDLFNIDSTDCDEHDGHGAFDIKLSAETLKNFVALLRFDGTNWVLVDGAKVENDHLMFTSKELGNFAIVVDNGSTPKTGDSTNVYFWVMVLAGSALAVVLFGLKKKRV